MQTVFQVRHWAAWVTTPSLPRSIICFSLQLDFQFDVVPTSVTAFARERVEYYCVAPCAGIFWLINDTIAGADHNIAVSTWTRARSDSEPGEESTLWITASVYANNSAIKCGVEDRSIGFETHSTPAYLTVQGTLHSIHNLTWMYIYFAIIVHNACKQA